MITSRRTRLLELGSLECGYKHLPDIEGNAEDNGETRSWLNRFGENFHCGLL